MNDVTLKWRMAEAAKQGKKMQKIDNVENSTSVEFRPATHGQWSKVDKKVIETRPVKRGQRSVQQRVSETKVKVRGVSLLKDTGCDELNSGGLKFLCRQIRKKHFKALYKGFIIDSQRLVWRKEAINCKQPCRLWAITCALYCDDKSAP